MRNLTIGGLALDFTGEPRRDWLRWALVAYIDELVMYVTHDCRNATDAELDIEVTELLRLVARCESFADLPSSQSKSEEIRIAGALGLRLLHETVEALHLGRRDIETILLWNRMSLATREAATLWVVAHVGSESAAKSNLARIAANARHAQGPFAEVRDFARNQFRDWESDPSMYKSLAGFARDIADKFPIISNPVSVERWVRAWRSDGSRDR